MTKRLVGANTTGRKSIDCGINQESQRKVCGGAGHDDSWSAITKGKKMMQVSHFSSGALVGRLSPNPAAAFALGVVAHFAIDKVPHFWPASAKAKLAFTVVDYALAAGMLTFLVLASPTNRTNMLWGVAGSAAVDLLLVGVPFARSSKLGLWHSARQPHRVEPVWLVTDITFTAICIALIGKL